MDFLDRRQDLGTVNVAADWRIIMTDVEIQQCVQKCADYINKNFVGKKIVVTCILKGAVYFFTDLTRKLTIPHSCYFVEASSYKDKHVQEEKVEILSKIIPAKFADRHVILIDELYDNGGTMNHIKEAIHTEGNVSYDKIFTCTLFKKSKDTFYLHDGPDIDADVRTKNIDADVRTKNIDTDVRTKNKAPDLVGIEVPDMWLVGYGLDDQQEKRGWTYLFACPKMKDVPHSKDDIIFDFSEAYDQMRSRIMDKVSKLKS